jgi:hypothetical protein
MKAGDEEDPNVTYLVLHGLSLDFKETDIINSIAPHIRVYVTLILNVLSHPYRR